MNVKEERIAADLMHLPEEQAVGGEVEDTRHATQQRQHSEHVAQTQRSHQEATHQTPQASPCQTQKDAAVQTLQCGEGGGRGQVCSVGHSSGTHERHGEALQGLEGHAPPRHPDDIYCKAEHDGVGKAESFKDVPRGHEDRHPGREAHCHRDAHEVLLSAKVLQQPEQEGVQYAEASPYRRNS
ncbi:hypothetical protein E2C01_002444 [Portunus trituberculatus]|uniref:Uncharacterized protein n=1 Tax=Portunus trituberculatus TaxID=210409 RepID=A0A5B7CN93_PORTR|nr:hypothetical protein [Portunus trituberculatus]